MRKSSIRIRKNFDLNSFPEGALHKAKSASLKLHLGILDLSAQKNRTNANGLTEEFGIFINGHKIVFKTSDLRFAARCKERWARNNWAYIDFPAKWLQANPKQAVVEIYKLNDSSGDDFLYPSIDPSAATEATFVSTDKGEKWSKEWLGNKRVGEFICRLLISPHDAPARDLNNRWIVETTRPGVAILRCDKGNFYGYNSLGVVPINRATTIARKSFDLNKLPAELLKKAKFASLRLHIGIVDYSMSKKNNPRKGLNEEFYITINGHKMVFKTSDSRFPHTDNPRKRRRHGWIDIPFPAEYLAGCQNGKLIVDISKLPSKYNDDYIYPSLDNTVGAFATVVSFDSGRTWSRNWLNTEGNCELIMRLTVADHEPVAKAVWEPQSGKLNDPEKIINYRKLENNICRLELNKQLIDYSQPFKVEIEFEGQAPQATYAVGAGEGAVNLPLNTVSGKICRGIIPEAEKPETLNIIGSKSESIKRITLQYALASTLPGKAMNMAPKIAAARGKRSDAKPSCKLTADTATITTPGLTALFKLRPRLSLSSLHVAEIGAQILRHPEAGKLFRIRDAAGKIHDGSELPVKSINPLKNGFKALLEMPKAKLIAEFTVRAVDDEIKFALNVRNAGDKKTDFTIIFPHFDGLVLSAKSENDFYLFPWGGGVIGDKNCSLRTPYGGNEAWWQMIDLFSPERGGGIYLRSDDPDATFKCLALRKGDECPPSCRVTPRYIPGRLDRAMFVDDPLEQEEGIGIAMDYQKFTRNPGKLAVLPEAALGSHAGGWKNAMKRYAAWAKQQWKPRPYPNELSRIWNTDGCGGGGKALYPYIKDPKRMLRSLPNITEMCSYWSSEEKGPWNTPIDRLYELYPNRKFRDKLPVGYHIDPVTGQARHSLNRGDYDGYNPQWGGLPALQNWIRTIRDNRQLVILYTDPMLASPNTKLARAHGKDWGVRNKAWRDPRRCPKNPKEPVGQAYNYFSYVMCLNCPEYSHWVAKNMARLLRETGASGIRFDEYGNPGYICMNPEHKHMVGEYGHNSWLQALALNVGFVRKELDKIDPKLIIMLEMPGNDRLMLGSNGVLTYDIRRRVSPLRPVQINLARFYFPECRILNLVENDNAAKKTLNTALFNAVGGYAASRYPAPIRKMFHRFNNCFCGKIDPLVPTLHQGIYANRFTDTKTGITVFTVFNTTGHTVDIPYLPAPDGKKYRYINPLDNDRELIPEKTPQGPAVRLALGNGQCVCIAKIPR